MTSKSLSFDDSQEDIPILLGGTRANVFDWDPFGSLGRIIKKSTLAEVKAGGWGISEVEGSNQSLYLFEFEDGRDSEYIWRSDLYPVLLKP